MGKPSASRCSRGRAKTSICPDLAFVAAGCRSPSDHPATDRGETIVRWSFPHFHRADDDFSRSATESRSASTIGSCPFPVSASLSCIGYLNCPTILARQTSEPEHKAIGDRKAALAGLATRLSRVCSILEVRSPEGLGDQPLPAADRGLGWGRNRPCQRPIPASPNSRPRTRQHAQTRSPFDTRCLSPQESPLPATSSCRPIPPPSFEEQAA